MTAAEVVAAARAMIGTPYRHQGRLPGIALDCVGLVVAVARQGAAIPADFHEIPYGRQPDGSLVDMLRRWCLPLDAPRAGCVAVMRWVHIPQHVGIITGETMIHAHQMLGGVVEHRINDAWRRRMIGYWLLPGMEL